jgi:hypothetical protein
LRKVETFHWRRRGWKGGVELSETTVKRLLCCGFRCTGKMIGQVHISVYQCWWRICWEMNVFSRFEYHMFYVLYPFVTYLLILSCTSCHNLYISFPLLLYIVYIKATYSLSSQSECFFL